MDNKILFNEVQKFRQWWVWFLVIVAFSLSTGIYSYALIRQIVFKLPFGSKPTSDTSLIIQSILLILFGVWLLWLFITTKLVTKVYTDRICLKFYPFQRTFICFGKDRIKSIQERKYSAMKDFGGFGIRKNKYGFAYIVRGNTGIQIELMEGTKILIGTQKPNKLKNTLKTTL